jgi:hypothetical protein
MVRERIKLASKIRPRPADDLREEERIIVYRRVIQDLLAPKQLRKNGGNPAARSSSGNWHVLSELLNAFFDIDKMLYFVAPDWWKPRHTKSKQFPPQPPQPGVSMSAAAAGTGSAVTVANTVSWDHSDPVPRDRYMITDESEPAKLGASLGWVLQLDGDNSRNAFINAPWVKVVVPIRPGREDAALNWLEKIEGMNGIGPSDIYAGSGTDDNGTTLNGKPLREVLRLLAGSIKAKHERSSEPTATQISDPQLPNDPPSVVTATPVDKVYEHGFQPLAGGFQAQPLAGSPEARDFAFYDQWVEIVPTDQIVPVPVAYDPVTGRLRRN